VTSQGFKLPGSTHQFSVSDSRRKSVHPPNVPSSEGRVPRGKNTRRVDNVGTGLHASKKLTATAYMTGCVGQIRSRMTYYSGLGDVYLE
jgi:hypothetical protein